MSNKKRNKKFNPRASRLRGIKNFLTEVTYKRVYMASNDPVSEEIKIDILAPLHMAILKMGGPDFTGTDFINLNKGMVTCWSLAAKHHQMTSDEETKRLMDLIIKSAEDAANALHDIGERFYAGESDIAQESEKAALRRCVGNYEELLGVTTSGWALRAIEEADIMVEMKLNQMSKDAA